MHAIETMMYAGEVPWHGLGTRLPRNLTWQDGMREAGLDWSVSLHRVFARHPRFGVDPEAPKAIEVTDARAVIRDSDASLLGCVGAKYRPVQNREAFETFGTFFGDQATLHTAGSLFGGRVVWGLAEAPEPLKIAGKDEHRSYLLVTNAHDGSGALRVYPTTVRVVCANTLAMSRGTQGEGISVRHVGDPVARLRERERTLKAAFGMLDGFKADMEALVSVPVTASDSRDILAKVFNAESTQGQNAIGRVLYLAKRGAGNAEYAGTAYGLFHGVTDYVDHAWRPKTGREDRFASVLLGAGAKTKAKALATLFAATGTKRPSDSLPLAA
jgi:phage/plasmid-like protein (TIGR03299 family)